jgi:hypothetical protein
MREAGVGGERFSGAGLGYRGVTADAGASADADAG